MFLHSSAARRDDLTSYIFPFQPNTALDFQVKSLSTKDIFPMNTVTQNITQRNFLIGILSLVMLLSLAPTRLWAQAGTLDPTFTTSIGADNGSVRWMVKLPGGDYLVAGDFSSYGGAARGGIARISPTGALVGGFAPVGVPSGERIACMGRRSDGNIYIGGNFTSYNGTATGGFALIDPANGNLVAGFLGNAGTGLTTIAPGPAGVGEVFTMAVQSDDKVLIGGTFELYNGIPRVSIARANTDGTLDLVFSPGDGPFDAAPGDGVCCDASGVYPGVRSIKIDGGTGKIYVSGFFTGFQPGVAPFYYDRRYLTRLNADGSMDAAFDPTPGTANDACFFSGGASAWPLEFDGTKLLVGGNFTTFNAGASTTTRNQIARLNNDGTLDAAFNPANGVNGTEIQSISLMANGTYLIGGTFTNYYAIGNNRNRIARVNPDGTLDVNFNPGTGANQTIFFILPDGDFALIGGLFTNYNGTTVSRIARVRNAAIPTAFTAPPSTVAPAGILGVPYSFTFVANGSPAPSYALVSGVLPTGLSLAASGALTGTPSATGGFAFTLRASNAGGDYDQAFTLTVNQRSLNYGATGFTEALANNGSINNASPLTITLSSDTFTGTNGDDFVAMGKVTVGNLPAGLTALATRVNPTQIAITFTGAATNHANVNDISNFTLTFQNSAFTGGAAASVLDVVKNNLVIDFLDPYTATYSGTSFNEAVANDGSITQTRTITLNGGENWTSSVTNGSDFTSPTHFTALNVPAGLTMVLTKNSATQVTVSFTGNATVHAAVNSVNIVEIAFTATALANAAPASVTNLNINNLTLNFGDGTATYSATDFPEAGANNGSITQTRTVTITGDTWIAGVANGSDFTSGVHFTPINVPSGLTMRVTKNSATQVTVSFTGSASMHGAANSLSNCQVQFLASALTAGIPMNIAGLNGTNLALNFIDPAPVAPSIFTLQNPPNTIGLGQSYSFTFQANGSPAPAYAVASGMLPPGLTLNAATGVLSGTPSASGTFGPIVVQAANAGGMLNTVAFSISVLPPSVTSLTPSPPLRFTLGDKALISASVGIPYSLTLIADGTPDPRYSITSGNLPRGLFMSPVGVISGTPSELGTTKFIVEARNIAGAITIEITLVVGPPRPFITQISREDVTLGDSVVIRGYNLSAVSGVFFGGISSIFFRIDSDNQITAVVGNGGSGLLTVTAPLGNSTSPGELRYTPPDTPEITGFETRSIPSGDDDYTLVVRGRNLSRFAAYSVAPLTNTNASFSVPLPANVLDVRPTQATLRLPLASRTIGLKSLIVALAGTQIRSTFAVIAGAPPRIFSQTISTTIASSQAFTAFFTGENFFRRGFGLILVNNELVNAEVLDSVRMRVEVPARMNVLGSNIRVRLTNYDGQFVESTINIVSRIAPTILSVQGVLRSGVLHFIITGRNFFGIPKVSLQNAEMRLVRNSPAELEIEIPNSFPRPRLTEEPWVLTVENPDTQRFGFRVSPSVFFPAPNLAFGAMSPQKTGNAEAYEYSEQTATTQSAGNSLQGASLRVFPNPAQDRVHIHLPPVIIGSTPDTYLLRVFDIRGNLLRTEHFYMNGEDYVFDTESLTSGVYVLELMRGSERLRGRFVKM